MKFARSITWLLCAGVATAAIAARADLPRKWSVDDSISVRYFATERMDSQLDDPVLAGSPDGRRFYVRSRVGNRDIDGTDEFLDIYDVGSTIDALTDGLDSSNRPKPRRVTFRSARSAARCAILSVQWSADSAFLFVHAFSKDGTAQGFRIGAADGVVQQCTRAPLGISKFVVNGSSTRGIIYFEKQHANPVMKKPKVMQLLSNEVESSEKFVQVGQTESGKPWSIADCVWFAPFEPVISPDGKHAILLVKAAAESAAGAHIIEKGQFMCVDFETMSTSFVRTDKGDVPVLQQGAKATAVWAPDSKSVVIAIASGRQNDGLFPTIVVYDLADRRASDLSKECVPERRTFSSLSLAGDGVAVVSAAGEGPRMEQLVAKERGGWRITPTLRRIDSSGNVSPWIVVGEKAISLGSLVIEVDEDFNRWPCLVARRGDRKIVLDGPGDQSSQVQLAPTVEVRWRENGVLCKGGLTLPLDHEKNSRMPLVIQAYHFRPDLFLPDGPYASIYATQALAAKGIAVLNINIMDLPDYHTANEGASFVRRIDSAVASLRMDYNIDFVRIGLVGFSRGGYLVHYSVTHPSEVPIAAAIIGDSTTFSWAQAMDVETINHGTISAFDRINGGSFWVRPEEWLAHVPEFNVVRSRTPTLFFQFGTSGGMVKLPSGAFRRDATVDAITTIGAYRTAHRPFEFLFIPGANHNLARPSEMMEAMQAAVDWMCFWLKSENPADPERAARWAVLRKQQDEVLKTPPPPKGKWVFQPDPVQPEWHPPEPPKIEAQFPARAQN